MNISKEELYRAYLKARKGKSKNRQVQERIKNEKENLNQLYNDLIQDKYKISQPTRYIIQDPVPREIIALPFRDRIVQHFIHEALYPLVEKQAIYDVYNNMLGKGTLFGVKRASKFIRACSDNFTKDTYVLKLDIRSFFLSINKDILFEQVKDLITKNIWKYNKDRKGIMGLVQQSIYYNYRNYKKIGSDKNFPFHKSMRSSDGSHGLPLGNLTSQLFANIYMHMFDLFVKHNLKIKYYGRYVDDFMIVHNSKLFLLSCLSKIRLFLKFQLDLTLHPHKIYIQNILKGFRFLGIMIYPYHRTICKRTIGRSNKMLLFTESLEQKIKSFASYYGMAIHHNCYRLQITRLNII